MTNLFIFFLHKQQENEGIKLGLKEYYLKYNILQELPSFSKNNIDNYYSNLKKNTDSKLIFYQNKKNNILENPTQITAYALHKIFNGDLEFAKYHAQWLLDNSININDSLFFPIDSEYTLDHQSCFQIKCSSASTQGLALGLFTYLYRETQDKKYLQVADKIYRSFYVPIDQGGFTRFDSEGIFFEEHPTKIPTRVLKGAAIAVISLHDYAAISQNIEACELFHKSLNRLSLIIPQYELNDPATGLLLSYYSLGKTTTKTLGRFVGNGTVLISEMKLIGIKSEQKKILSSVRMKKNEDTQTTKNFYLYVDGNMNWGEVIDKANKFRSVNGVKGKYNHSPFNFTLPLDQSFERYEIEVTYKIIGKNQLSLQLFDETEYWSLGNLRSPKNLNLVDNKITTQAFPIPKNFIKVLADKYEKKPEINPNYFDDNQQLIHILGKISNSQKLINYAIRWKDSTYLVPSRFFNNSSQSILINTQLSPTLALVPNSIESTHVEYPSIMRVNNIYHMYYSAYGKDKKWRIFLATSKDGIKFNRQGLVFTPQDLPANCQGKQAFPFVVKFSKDSYLMYFSCASQPQKSYERIVWASSVNGRNWKYGGIAINESGLDPFVILQPDGNYAMFYSLVSNNKILIKRATSKNGREWSNYSIVAESSPIGGLYTISGLQVDKKVCLLLQSSVTRSKRYNTLLYCDRGDGKFLPSKDNPVIVDKTWEKKWDTIRYGFHIFPEGDKYIVYHNVIPELGAEIGGQIARSELNMEFLKSSAKNLVTETNNKD
ncbi:D-glucuronyl C5-epimerase family protein [Calothrix sp. 336/3]